MDVIDRLPQQRVRGAYLKQELQDKLVDHRRYIKTYGDDLPEVRDWKWGPYAAAEPEAPPELRR
jgi:xylulose-5-phosphate/fructose-6-phosphate phosphoketolase